MKKYDIQLGILVLTGFVVFGFSFDSVRTSPNTQLQVMGAFSGDRVGCLDEFIALKKGPLEVRQTDSSCADVELLLEMTDKSLSVFDRRVTYRMSVTNHGPDTAHALHVRNVLPKSFIPVSVSGDIRLGSYSMTHDFYFIPVLEPNTTTFIDVVAEVAPIACGQTHKSHGFVRTSQEFDMYPQNNYDTQIFVVPNCPKWNKVSMP